MRSVACAVCAIAACGNAEPGPSATRDAPTSEPRPLPQLVGSEQRCKLLNDRNTASPTRNDVHHRANVLGADLGIPLAFQDTLYIFFGDTIGWKGIWGAQSHPDSVGYGRQSATQIAANPSLLCDGLGIIRLARDASVGPGIDPAIEADFAGNYMRPPGGEQIASYIHNPAGGNGGPTFPNLPGDFEVPSGAFAHAGQIYVFYTTVVSPQDITMKGSYLARWAAPSPSSIPAFDILHGVDQRFDGNGALGGDFINIAAEVHGDHVYLFGTGDYRNSAVKIARKPLALVDRPGGYERLDVSVAPAGHGETSVRYFAELDRWMFLAQEQLPASNRVVARFADRPEGPWSDAIVVHDMGDPAFRQQYCCAVENDCVGPQFMNCARTGFYGAYLLPEPIVHGDGSFTVTYTLSSFDPYNVALFSATFR